MNTDHQFPLYRDYADGSKIKSRELPAIEFIRRFSLHLLPRAFTKIRHYGLLINIDKPNDKRWQIIVNIDRPNDKPWASEQDIEPQECC